MQHKKLMTNSFPIVLETQIADDLKIFGSLSADTARAIDCANADTFCKPVNIADIKSQTTAIAVQTFQEIATYDNAVQAANTVNVVTRRVVKFTLKAFVASCLLAIALGMSAADTWHQFKEWLEGQDLTPSQPVEIVRLVAAKIRKRVNRFAVHCYDRLQDWLETQTVRACYAIDENAIQPAAEFRDRLNAARLVITR